MSMFGIGKKMTDSNKENITPSSTYRSPGTNLSVFEENSLKQLHDQKESIISNAEWVSSENYKLFHSKDDLTRSTIENESISHKDKSDSDNLNDILRDREFRNNMLANNLQECNYWLKSSFFSELINYEFTSNHSLDYRLKNEYIINALVSNSKGNATCHKIYNKNPSSKDQVLDKESEPLIIKYFLAYNLK
jgi:hypothetical protein